MDYSPQLKLYSKSNVLSNPSQYKYLVVGTGMTGIAGQLALSGRFVSFLAHSGSVVGFSKPCVQVYFFSYTAVVGSPAA